MSIIKLNYQWHITIGQLCSSHAYYGFTNIILKTKNMLLLFATFNFYFLDDSRQGHFRSILKYRAKGDEFLRNVLEGSGKRNKYTSPTIQNEIIQSCNTILLRKLVNVISKSKCFSVLADETTDISTKEQLSICV